MTAKEYLSQAFKIDRQINERKLELEGMQQALYGKAINYENDGSQHNPNGNSVERAYVKVMSFKEDVNEQIGTLVDTKADIIKAIHTVDDIKLQEILTRRYIKFQKWELIAVEMDTDLRWIHRLHNRALSKIRIDH